MDDRVLPAPRRSLRADAERNRRAILKAAAEVFAMRGLDACLEEIARQAGVGTGTVYRRFATKAELIDALFEDRIDALVTLGERAARTPDSWAALTCFVEGAVRMQVADRALADLLFSNPPGNDRLVKARERMLPVVSAIVARAQRDGHLRDDIEPTDIPMLEFMLVAVDSFSQDRAPELWRRYLAVLLDGLRKRPDGEALASSGMSVLPVPALTVEELEEGCAGARTRRRPPSSRAREAVSSGGAG